MPPRLVLATATNPDGRLVVLYAERWGKVLARHTDMADHLDDVVAALKEPDYRTPDPRPGRERYHRRGGPMPWLRVVVELDEGFDWVVTAFGVSGDPR